MKLSARLSVAALLLAFGASTTAFAADNFGADRHVARGVKCESCHGPDKKIEYPEKEQCIQCHDPKKIAEQTKNVKPANPHDSPHYHQDLECTLCHVQHAKPENYCNQCHKFDFKVK